MLRELETLANKLNEERARLNRTLDGITDDEATRTMITPEWSVKDAVAHLAGAERGMLRIGQRMAEGINPQLPEGYNNDEYNARQVAKRKNQSLVDIRKELEGSRAELLALLEATTLGQLETRGEHPLLGQTTLKDLLVIIYSHETSHSNEIANQIRESKK